MDKFWDFKENTRNLTSKTLIDDREYERCLKYFEINDFDVLGKIYQECGLNSIYVGKYIKALDYYQKALIAYE